MRITLDMLYRKVSWLNEIMGYKFLMDSPTPPIGSYFIDIAYGRYALYQHTINGERDVFDLGHSTKSELYYLIVAYMKGLENR